MRGVAGGYGRYHSQSSRKNYGHDYGVYMNPPLMEAYAAALAEQLGVEVRIIDGQIENLGLTNFVRRVNGFDHDLLFVRISLPSYHWDMRIISVLRKELPDTQIIAWGTVCRALPQKILDEFQVDAVSGTSIELTIQQLLKLELYKDGLSSNGILMKKNEQKPWSGIPPTIDLDSLPIPAYHLLNMDQYIAWGGIKYFIAFASRGCSFACDYCPYPFGFGYPWKGRNPKNVIAEFVELHDNFGIERIVFRDQTWNMNMKTSKTFCRLLKERDIKIQWSAEIRPDKLSLDLARSMRQAGCFRVEMGVETGDPEIFEMVGKKASRLSFVKQGFDYARQVGLITVAQLMVGLPGDSWESINKTRFFLEKLHPDLIYVAIATPYPGTKFYEEAIKNNWLISDQLDHLDANTPVLEYPKFSTSDIAKAKTFLRNWGRADSLLRSIKTQLVSGKLIQASKNLIRISRGIREFYPRIIDLLRK